MGSHDHDPINPIHPRYLDHLDPAFVKYYAKHGLGHKQVQELSIEEHRSGVFDLNPPGRSKATEVGKETKIQVPVAGGSIPVRVYEPKGDSTAVRPCYINLHGGGWVIGGGGIIDKPFCTLMVHELGCVAFDVDYRLAPEFPYPVPLDDCWAAILYIIENAAKFNIDVSRIAVGGCSAGGHLSAVTSIMARDNGTPFVFQLLTVPCIDATATDESGEVKVAPDCPYESWTSNDEAPDLPLASMVWYHNHFLGLPRPEGYKTDWKISPIKTPSLKNLPPALVTTAEFDVLRDEGEAYAARLKEEGNEVTLVRMKAVPHTFPLYDAVLDAGKQYNRLSIDSLRKAFKL